ncbi:hypothetical protein [Fervidibacter sacchari]
MKNPEGFAIEVNDTQGERPLIFACGRTPRATFCGWEVASDAEDETRFFWLLKKV